MVSKAALATVIVLSYPPCRGRTATATSPPDGGRQKVPCVRASIVLLDQPALTIEQLTKGPDFDASDP